MALICVTGPVVEPVTLAEVKAHCRVDVDDDDGLLANLVMTAREHLESLARPQLAMTTQTWRYVLDSWPTSDTVELRPYPLRSVSSVKYTDDAGAETTLPSSLYLVDTISRPGRLRLRSTASWPNIPLQEMNGLVIEFDAGYGDDGSSVPMALRQAVLLLAAHWYETREPVLSTGAIPKEVPMTVASLFRSWRREV